MISGFNTNTGALTYTPNANFNGTDRFTFLVNDGTTNSGPATVSLTVAAVNHPPLANNQSVTLDEGTSAPIVLTGTDADSDPLTFAIVNGPTNGVISGFNTNTGALIYTPNANFNGTDSFTFLVNDGTTNSGPATVSLTVTPVNDAPVAVNDDYRMFRNTTLNVPINGVLSNDSDVDGDTLTAVLVSGPTHAAAFTLNPDGSFSYTPATNYVGPDSFTYEAKDKLTNSATVTVTLTVVATNTAPVAVADAYSVNQDNTLNLVAPGVLGNDRDADGDPLTAVLVTGPTNAVAFILNPDGSFSYTPAPNYIGPDSFTYRANDRLTNSEPVTVSLTVTPAQASGCNLYPIALHERSLAGIPEGGIIHDIYNGVQPGNFGWLTWAGSPNVPTLATSLTPPGDSGTYTNPTDPSDHVVSVGDWVQGKPGVSNSRQVRDALEDLKQIDITVPVWDQASGTGNNSLYRVSAFARVRLLSYRLPKENRITARFLGFVSCK